jgi:ribosome-binding factor A
MTYSRVQDIKKAQKERLFFREISNLFLQITLDDSRVQGIFITRVKLSPDKSLCTVYFYAPEGEEFFKTKLEVLKLYKPSMRKAIAAKIEARYTPDIRFIFDDQYEKQEELELLMDKIKKEETS